MEAFQINHVLDVMEKLTHSQLYTVTWAIITPQTIPIYPSGNQWRFGCKGLRNVDIRYIAAKETFSVKWPLCLRNMTQWFTKPARYPSKKKHSLRCLLCIFSTTKDEDPWSQYWIWPVSRFDLNPRGSTLDVRYGCQILTYKVDYRTVRVKIWQSSICNC